MSARRGSMTKNARRVRRPQASIVSSTSLEAVGRFVRILARCGATPPDIVRAVRAAARRIPARWALPARAVPGEIDDGAAHVLTVWFSELNYLDAAGRPLSLPLKGASRSFATLVRSVDSSLDPRDVLEYLLRQGAIRRQGRRFVPRGRTLQFRTPLSPELLRHTLRALTNMLGTLENNVQPKRITRFCFEYTAENPRFPARAREELGDRVKRLGTEVLSRLDAYMRRREVTRRPGEPTMHVGIGMHLWEDSGRSDRAYRAARSRARTARTKKRGAL
jgi:hypothetical protein